MSTSSFPPTSIGRRISVGQKDDGHDLLKNIAGLIQKLSYRDMRRFSDLLEAQNLTGNDTAECLLAAADAILTDTAPTPKKL